MFTNLYRVSTMLITSYMVKKFSDARVKEWNTFHSNVFSLGNLIRRA